MDGDLQPLLVDVAPDSAERPSAAQRHDVLSQQLTQLWDHDADGSFLQSLSSLFSPNTGLCLYTDFSGMGCPEMVVSLMAHMMMTNLPEPPNLLCWRASDVDPICRRTLKKAQRDGPRHVFGNIRRRVDSATNAMLNGFLRRAESAFQDAVVAKASTSELKTVAESIGNGLMSNALTALQSCTWQEFDWCYRTKSRAPVHAPKSDRKLQHMVPIAVAGTVCKQWSAMNTQARRFRCQTALSMLTWCMELMWLQPHMAIHECTPFFDVAWLVAACSSLYFIQTLVFSCLNLGQAYNRKRRYTILLHKGHRIFNLSYEVGFSTIFFKDVVEDATKAYFIAGQAAIDECLKKLAANKFICDHAGWSCRDLLPECLRQRLLGYEKLARRRFLPCNKYIVNLCQEASFTGLNGASLGFSVVPTILTKTSTLWNMRLGRLMLLEEMMLVHQVPTLDDLNQKGIPPFGFQTLLAENGLPENYFVHLLGNGMALCQLHAVMLFGLATTLKKSSIAVAIKAEPEEEVEDAIVAYEQF